jgi:hypothetical protein
VTRSNLLGYSGAEFDRANRHAQFVDTKKAAQAEKA